MGHKYTFFYGPPAMGYGYNSAQSIVDVVCPALSVAPKDLKVAAVDQGTTILLVDQNIQKALELSDFMYLLEIGQVKQAGPKESFESHIREIIRDSLIAR